MSYFDHQMSKTQGLKACFSHSSTSINANFTMIASIILSVIALAASATTDSGSYPAVSSANPPVLTPAVSYDTGFDSGSRTLNSVTCSNGDNGLESRYHWQTQDQIPSFPFIGGAKAISGWNSLACGTCWTLEYQGRFVTFLAIDRDADGFNLGLHAMNDLTGGRAVEVGRINATAFQVDVKQCGL